MKSVGLPFEWRDWVRQVFKDRERVYKVNSRRGYLFKMMVHLDDSLQVGLITSFDEVTKTDAIYHARSIRDKMFLISR
jgi:hypothetical protein